VTDIEERIQQIAQVLGQLDDTQVPRNIRASAKDAVDKWLLKRQGDGPQAGHDRINPR
jgi:uncharacterized protein (UPF0147 family)